MSRTRQPRRASARAHAYSRARATALSLAAALCALSLVGGASAQPMSTGHGSEAQVQIPLEVYQRLVAGELSPAPASYALGPAVVSVTLDGPDAERATVSVTMTVQNLAGEWALVPILPAGSAVQAASVGGAPLALISGPDGLLWATNVPGTHELSLVYEVARARYDGGESLDIPLPRTSSTRLTATLPGADLGVAVLPATAVTVSEGGGVTTVVATLPATRGVQLTWRGGTGEPVTMSRATYRGEVVRDAVRWQAEFAVELGSDAPVRLPLLPAGVALEDMQVDGVEAAILVDAGVFVVPVQGRGAHRVVARFSVPIGGERGAPTVALDVPMVPVSRFELTLPGEKEVRVAPAASVEHETAEGNTVARVNVPMTPRVTFSWNEAVPGSEGGEEEVRANASLHHLVHAEEGVLYVDAAVDFEVTRGESSLFELTVPEGTQVNAVTAPAGVVADWRLSEEGSPRTLSIFLDRRLGGTVSFRVACELILPRDEGAPAATEVTVPLLSALGVSRQRGMVALLASRELALEPVREGALTRVGENQLPPALREGTSLTIAHTFRYFEGAPELVVRPAVPVREDGRFDAQVDSLVSVGDVTIAGAATIEVNVKSGSIMGLSIVLPADVNVLGLTGPSLRSDEVVARDGQQVIEVAFTREMEGQFRLELAYERIMGDAGSDVPVPLPTVLGAQVEQGRVAVEALSAVEVRTARAENLSSLEIGELPRQLILRTTNPILLAYRYVQAQPAPELALRITQHREIDVQAAIIDEARYRTLHTRDGFVVTTARFRVRNSREQFLRIAIPADAEVWAASVDGSAEVPAVANGGASDEGGEQTVLINIINSAQGFPVELIYAQRAEPMGFSGTIEAALPRPDMIVTETVWDIYLPDDLRYGEAESTLRVIEEAAPFYQDDASLAALGEAPAGAQVEQPLRISVPESGVRFRFSRLYANQGDGPLLASIPYASLESANLAMVLVIFGTALFFFGGVALLSRPRRGSVVVALAAAAAGAGLVVFATQELGAPLLGALYAAAAFAALRVARALWRGGSRRAGWRARQGAEGATAQ
jgi:hypothetical protein